MFHITKTLEFPKELIRVYAKAIQYEWLSFFYMISTTIFTFIVMGNSQTMKTVWLEDTLGIIPPLSFLIASKIVRRKANRNFPYGFHESTGMAYFASSLALLALGIFLFVDGSTVLIKGERPNLPYLNILNYSIWQGYIMIVALLWSSLPSTILGHVKIPLAHKLYDKILYADSKMNKASWMSGFASIIGIIGIGFGYWWADASIGILISLSIMNDGFSNMKQSILDLLEEVPKLLGEKTTDPLISEVKKLVLEEDWITSVHLRFRDEGHVYFGDVFIVPKEKNISVDKIDSLRKKITQHHWRLHDIVIMPIIG